MGEFRYKVGDKDVFVVKVGSRIFDSNPDSGEMEFFVTSLKRFASNCHIMVVTGGGELSRRGDRLMQVIDRNASKEKRDLVGIIATKYHAQFLNEALDIRVPIWEREPTRQEIGDFLECRHRRIQIVSGWYPGSSSDGPAIMLADKVGVDLIKIGTPVMLNPDYPETIINYMLWQDYFQKFPCRRDPSGRVPIDADSAKFAHDCGLSVAIGSWVDLVESLDSFFKRGTVIIPSWGVE